MNREIGLSVPVAASSVDWVESRLLSLAALFLFFYSLALSLAPAARARSWQVDYRWDHWLGFALWLALFFLAHRYAGRQLPQRDPYLLPIGALLSGWGMLIVWRLLPGFGMRQCLWLVIAVGVLILGLRLPNDLAFLRRYKYLWLISSLLLAALTLLLGTNPMGYGPRMWLGCCGVYLQPSEPLKLLLIAYLAAYMADHLPFFQLSVTASLKPITPLSPLLPLLAPTLIMTGLALALLLIQRDLGTATIFLLLYATIVYVTTGRRRLLVFTLLALVLAGLAGYWLFEVVRVRVDAWLNPWLDPSGRSYQIVQSLLAIANGGLWGRGPGLGSPGLVPVAHSDMIYAALAEEHGLIGAIGLLLLISLMASRSLRAALYAGDSYRRFLAAGLTTYLVGQGLLIICGSLRLLPLTGVTLPFLSYGGSSLVVSFLSLLLLLHISDRTEEAPVVLREPVPYLQLESFFLVGLAAAALATGWWAVYRGPGLLSRTDNPRLAISDRFVRRGSILDRSNNPINATFGSPGDYTRRYQYPDLSNVVGYNDPTYGQSGLESSLDDTLRGLKGNAGLSIWWNHLLYGQPPPGLDVRLSLDMKLQQLVDSSLVEHRGALVVLNADSGEILVMASHPTFDANLLEDQWENLVVDSEAPLLNRAVLGRYPLGDLGKLFPQGAAGLGVSPTPPLRLPTGDMPGVSDVSSTYSPLQMALVAAVISSGGIRPAPQMVTAVNTTQAGWVILSPLSEPLEALSVDIAAEIAAANAVPDLEIWQKVTDFLDSRGQALTWYLGGTLPGLEGTPYVMALLLEENNPELAIEIGRTVFEQILPK